MTECCLLNLNRTEFLSDSCDVQLRANIAQKRVQAVELRKAGLNEEALSLLRETKALEKEIERLQASFVRRDSSARVRWRIFVYST
jgi:hypothetical protein